MSVRIVGGEFRGRTLAVPTGESTRPTAAVVREAVFNICQNHVVGGRFLDLFAGSGAMGLEAISRGAAGAVLVENHPRAIKAIQRNIETLGVTDQAHLHTQDAFRVLQRLQPAFRVIYADPPYGDAELCTRLLQVIDSSDLLEPGGLFFLEVALQTALPTYEPVHLKSLGQRRYGKSVLLHYTRESA